ncbi:hypothetical protein PG997_000066 [Apiospora hydei]|uniref:Zn(2)-C6 fungal-type domain-containing protein n=1 Tax=Apiospora hydei TaxID=1337664 RepID=A0ABR1X9J2_9PEZI
MPSQSTEKTPRRPAKRRKVENPSCQECRDKKTGCDKARPICGSCKRKRLPAEKCGFPDTIQAADPETPSPSASSADYVQSLESKIRSLERDLEHFARQTPPTLRFHRRNTRNSNTSSASAGHGDATPHVTPTPSSAGSFRSQELGTPLFRRGNANRAQETLISTPDNDVINRDRGGGEQRSDAYEPGGFTGAPERTADESGRTALLSHSSSAAVLREEQDSAAQERGHRTSLKLDHAVIASSSSASVSATQKKTEGLVEDFMGKMVLPAPKTADAHLEKYWTYIQPIHPLLHKSTFMERYNYVYDKQGDGTDSHDQPVFDTVHAARAFHITLNLVFALGCIYHFSSGGGPESSKESAAAFFDRSQELLRDADPNYAVLSLVQAHLLTTHYLQSTGKIDKCWVAVGTAIRLAQGDGIQRDLASESQDAGFLS